jgi:glucosyl-dolichyl phosphate glucuronosyltransferase
MRISVVIATYNRAGLLESTLAQLRRQQYEAGDEIVVVDNASTDATPAVIARAAATSPVPFHHLRELTPGKTPALNRGIAAAHGEILALTDDDVIVADDWIATIRQMFLEPSLALAGGRVDPWWERPAPRWLRIAEQGYGPLCSPLALLHYGDLQALDGRTAVGANLVVRRAVLESLGGFTPHLGRRAGTLLCGEDHDFCQRAAAAGYRCEYHPELRVRHWVPAERLTLRYFLRWFFWSGITAVILERMEIDGRDASQGVVAPYLVRRLLTAPVSAVRGILARDAARAVEALMDGAFVAGSITERIRARFRRGCAPSTQPEGRTMAPAAPQLPSPVEPPAPRL